MAQNKGSGWRSVEQMAGRITRHLGIGKHEKSRQSWAYQYSLKLIQRLVFGAGYRAGKYKPHQGAWECERRRLQMAAGRISYGEIVGNPEQRPQYPSNPPRSFRHDPIWPLFPVGWRIKHYWKGKY